MNRRLKIIRLDANDIIELLKVRGAKEKNNKMPHSLIGDGQYRNDAEFTYLVVNGVPNDLKYKKVHYSHHYGCFEIIVESKEFEEIPFSVIPPPMSISYYTTKFKECKSKKTNNQRVNND